MRRLLPVFLAFFVLSSAPAEAQYKKYVDLGKQQQKEGKHAEAVKSFRRALQFEVKPGAQYFMALSFIKLKRYADAKRLLLVVQRHPHTPSVVKDIIPSKLAMVELELRRKHAVRVALKVDVANLRGATVLLNGSPVGVTPFTQELKPGTVQLVVRMKGYKDHVESLSLVENRPLERKLTLQVLPQWINVDAPGFRGAKVFLDGQLVGTVPVRVQRVPKSYRMRVSLPGHKTHDEEIVVNVGEPLVRTVALLAVQKQSKTLRIVAYITGGVAIAGLATAGAFHALAIKSRNASADPTNTQQDAISKYNKSKTQMNIAYAMYGVGGAALVAAVTCLVLDLTRKPRERNVMVVPHRSGASLFVRF